MGKICSRFGSYPINSVDIQVPNGKDMIFSLYKLRLEDTKSISEQYLNNK
jgi:hypothetical protein